MADPAHEGENYLRQTLGSIVPAVVARTAAGLDPVKRETRDGLTATLRSRVPRLSQGLPAKVDQLGAPLERSDGGASGFVASFVDPTSPSPGRAGVSPVHAELTRLHYAPSRLRQDTKNGETREDFYTRRERDGQELQRELAAAIATDAYQSIPLETRWLYQTAPEEFTIPTRSGQPARQRRLQEVIDEQQMEYLRGIVQSVRNSQRQTRNLSVEAAASDTP
jgi:hypothetical protein